MNVCTYDLAYPRGFAVNPVPPKGKPQLQVEPSFIEALV